MSGHIIPKHRTIMQSRGKSKRANNLVQHLADIIDGYMELVNISCKNGLISSEIPLDKILWRNRLISEIETYIIRRERILKIKTQEGK